MSKNIARILDERGWCVYESQKLGEVIILTKDIKTKVPESWQNAIRYTESEMAALREGAPLSDECLKEIHLVKKIFSGSTVQPG